MSLTLLAPELRHEDDARRSLTTTAAGIVIGGAWQRPMPTLTQDAERLQSALLDKRTCIKRPIVMRIAGAIYRWL